MVYRSGPAFYKIKGSDVGKPKTVNHRDGGHLSPKQKTFLQTFQSIPMDKSAIHDIRFSFLQFRDLWSILSVSESPLNKSKDLDNNKDITLQDIEIVDQMIKQLFISQILSL